jgi:hypothetical protein
MKRSYHRIGFSAAQSAELWEHWKKGEGLKSIGRAFGKPSSCVFAHIRPSGGIMPRVRRRSRLGLTLAEREEISRGLVANRSVRSMARSLGRSPSTVSREIECLFPPIKRTRGSANCQRWMMFSADGHQAGLGARTIGLGESIANPP